MHREIKAKSPITKYRFQPAPFFRNQIQMFEVC